MAALADLAPEWHAFVADARTATLTTLDLDGCPASVPICFVVLEGPIPSPIDEKPKRSTNPRDLRRVGNLLADPRATILVHRWDEDWERLAFASLGSRGGLVAPGTPGHAAAAGALRAKYPQYAHHALEDRPMLRFVVERAITWGDPTAS